MIRNEREYRVSRAFRRRLLATRGSQAAHPNAEATQREWLVGGVDRLLGDVEAEIAEYEALRAGAVSAVAVAGLGDLPAALVKARIAAGLTQRQLAERLGVAEQAVQRDEAGGYARATLDRLQRVAEALGLELEGTARLPTRASGARASD
jgi:HTH-type transcriptional regulator/antitoxin HipB